MSVFDALLPQPFTSSVPTIPGIGLPGPQQPSQNHHHHHHSDPLGALRLSQNNRVYVNSHQHHGGGQRNDYNHRRYEKNYNHGYVNRSMGANNYNGHHNYHHHHQQQQHHHQPSHYQQQQHQNQRHHQFNGSSQFYGQSHRNSHNGFNRGSTFQFRSNDAPFAKLTNNHTCGLPPVRTTLRDSQAVPSGLDTILSSVQLSSSKADNDALFLRHLMKDLRIDRPLSSSASASVVAPCAGYPSVLVSEIGTISVLLTPDVVVEISVDRTMRIACLGKFAACLTNDSTGISLSHELASVFQENSSIFTIFRVGGIEKQVVIGDEGIVYSMDGLANCFLVSDALQLNAAGNSVVPVQKKLFPSMRRDFSLRQFYASAETGKRCIDMCHEFVARANFVTEDGETRVVVNGVYIRLDRSGNIEISSRPRIIRFTPSTGAVLIKTPTIETAIDTEGRGYVVNGKKRVHASMSGLVVGDNLHVASVDHTGKLVTSL